MEQYFILNSSEDGISINGPLTKEQVLDRLDENYYGEVNFLNDIPNDFIDSGSGMVIIKGQIVLPKPKQVVQSYEVE